MAADAKRFGRRSLVESRALHALVAVAFGIAVFAVGVTGWWASTYLIPLQEVRDAVRTRLGNAESARFEHVWYSKQTGIGCGYVSVKNAAGGGYQDMRHFILFPGGDLQLEPLRDTKSDAAQQIAALEQQARHGLAVRANCLR